MIPPVPLTSDQRGFVWSNWFFQIRNYLNAPKNQTKAGLPTTSDIANGTWAVYKDTSGGTVRLWTNDNGTMKSVTLT